MRDYIAKTHAKSLYCLSDKDLAPLASIQKRNPHRKQGPPMQLYKTSEVEALAAAKHGGTAGLAAEQSKRALKRAARAEKKATTKAAAAAAGADTAANEAAGAAVASSPAAHLPLSPLITERVRRVTPAATHQGGGADPPAAADAHATAGVAQAAALPMAAHVEAAAAGPSAAVPCGSYVLYWMQTAVRVLENPALDVAAAQAAHLGVPLVVVAALLLTQPFATARRFQFLLEGLQEVQAQLQQQGVLMLVLCEGAADNTTAGSSRSSSGDGWSWTATTAVAAPLAAAAVAEKLEPEVAATLNAALLSPSYQQQLSSSPGWRSLLTLAHHSALLVTEDMPVAPEAVWVPAAAAALAAEGVGVWAVDTACVVPMRLTQRGYERAAGFRSATEDLRRVRITGIYTPGQPPTLAAAAGAAPPAAAAAAAAAGTPGVAAGVGQTAVNLPGSSNRVEPQWSLQQLLGVTGPLPCPPLDLTSTDLPGLVHSWAGIDKGVPPVTHLHGGPTAALQRWQHFKVQGLHLYASRRNDALQRDGVSRLSAYHRYGMVSPFQVAREAKFAGSSGVKFLDEFLVWREIAYHFCFHRWPVLDSLVALPTWAATTLAAHAADPRQQGVKSLQQLEGATTGDAFWDAAQHQLVTTGELHNNVRMTWGKALLPWSPSPQAALGRLLYLNHKYALDGCDPASYGGVLWCLGQFDGPRAAQDTPVTGSLRQRPTASHARRCPPEQYKQLPV